ncbi:adenylate/guanylate cyclase domain-containing protein [Thermodesulfobacteriota bacterium]
MNQKVGGWFGGFQGHPTRALFPPAERVDLRYLLSGTRNVVTPWLRPFGLLDEIHRYEGTINQFTGDGVMALFGAPVAHEDHSQRACYAALAIQKALEKYGADIALRHRVDFKMRLGLNSGQVVVGGRGAPSPGRRPAEGTGGRRRTCGDGSLPHPDPTQI